MLAILLHCFLMFKYYLFYDYFIFNIKSYLFSKKHGKNGIKVKLKQKQKKKKRI